METKKNPVKQGVAALIAVLVILALGLSACGRKGPPVAPGEEEPEYHRGL